MTTFGDMVFEFGGAPVSGARFSNPWSTHWFVDGDNGDDSNTGKSPNSSFSTIAKAIASATGQDVIYIRQRKWTLGTGITRYTEDCTITQNGSGSGVVDKNAGMCLVGVSSARRPAPTDFVGPRWKYASATPLTIYTPGTHLENIGFFAEDATYVVNLINNAPSSYGGTGFSAYNCSFKGDADFYANGIDSAQIVNCQFQAKYDGTMGGINFVGSANQVKRPVIKYCHFIGGNANNMATSPIQGAAPWLDAFLYELYFHAEPDDNLYVNIAGTTNTGLAANFYCGADKMSDLVTNGTTHVSGIFYVGMHDENTGVDMS